MEFHLNNAQLKVVRAALALAMNTWEQEGRATSRQELVDDADAAAKLYDLFVKEQNRSDEREEEQLEVFEPHTGKVLCRGNTNICYDYLRKHQSKLKAGEIDLRYESGRLASYVLR